MGRPTKGKGEKRDNRVYVYFNDEELKQLNERADQAGYRLSVFLRKVALAIPIRPKKSRQSQALITELHKLGGDLNRVGNNLNQLVKAANTCLASGNGKLPAEKSILHVLGAVRHTVNEIVRAITRV